MANISSINGNPIVVGTNGISNGSGTEAKLASSLANALIKGRGYSTDANLTDANQAERNSVVTIIDKGTVAHLPSGLQSNACMLVTLGTGAHTASGSIAFQLCLSVSKANEEQVVEGLWYRSRYGASSSVWSTWVCACSSTDGTIGTDKLADLSVTGAKLAGGAVDADKMDGTFLKRLLVAQPWVTAESGEFDADAVTRGTVYLITPNASVANFPEGAGANPRGFLVSLASGTANVGANSSTFQLFAEISDPSGTEWYGRVWYRGRWGTTTSVWSEWQQVATTDNVMELINQPALTDISMFRKVGVLGDSFASGSMYVNGVFAKQDYEQSWPMNMARQHGINVERYSQGGWGCYDWLHRTDSYGLDKFEADVEDGNVCGLYLICYGINDSNSNMTFGGRSGGLAYIGSEADINEGDYTQNANSFWGQLSRIICTIRDRCPNSKIIVSTLARENSSTRRTYTETVKEIAAYWDVPCIYLYGDNYFTSSWWNDGMDGNHPTFPMYAGMAVAMNRLISQCIGSNYSYFKDYTGIDMSDDAHYMTTDEVLALYEQ